VLSDGTAERRFIVEGGRYGSSIIISKGVRAGETVIVEGLHKVTHGEKVEIVDQPAAEPNSGETPSP